MLVKLTLKIYQKSKTIMLLQILFLVIRQQKTQAEEDKTPFVYDTGPMESKIKTEIAIDKLFPATTELTTLLSRYDTVFTAS